MKKTQYKSQKKILLLSIIILFFTSSAIGWAGSKNLTWLMLLLSKDASSVNGVIKNLSGKAIPDVSVQLVGGDATTTKNDGTFILPSDTGSDKIIIVSKIGYVKISKPVDVFADVTTTVVITMIAETAAQTLNSTSGGTITGPRNASINVPPGVFMNKNGRAITGDVMVSLTPLDPAVLAESMAYPGDMRGLTKGGEVVLLETFGVLDVTVRQNGEELQIRDGRTIQVQVPAPSLGTNPDSAQMWIFNEETGLWEESEDGLGTFDAATNTYTADIGHLSPLNVDEPVVPTCISGTIVDSEENPVGGAFVQAIPGFGGISSDYTDIDGNFCMYVERNQDMVLRVHTPLSESCPVEMQEDGVCVTTRAFRSLNSAIILGYPNDCSNNCKRIAVITTGDVDPGPLNEAACMVVAGVDNPFSGTCAFGLADMYDCFSPEGGCTYEMDPLNPSGATFEMEFDNGSKMESEFNVISGMQTKMYGPGGIRLCGTMTYTESGTMIKTYSGQEYIVRTTDSGGMEIECNGGMTFKLTAEQMDSLAGCSGSMEDDGSGVVCEAKAGTFGADCTWDGDCIFSNSACCPPRGEDKTCAYDSMCTFMCARDSECDEASICCSVGAYSMCLPAASCP